MVARRLLIVLVVLLGISSLLAVAAQRGADDSNDEPEETVAEPPPIEGSGMAKGSLFRVTVNANSPEIDVVGSGMIPLRVGDQVILTVVSKRVDQVEIPAFGQVAPVSRDSPANFDLLLEEPGSFVIKLTDAGRLAGRLEVSDAESRSEE